MFFPASVSVVNKILGPVSEVQIQDALLSLIQILVTVQQHMLVQSTVSQKYNCRLSSYLDWMLVIHSEMI